MKFLTSQMKLTSAGLFGALLLILSLMPSFAFAADDIKDSITLSPPSQRYTIKTGESQTGELSVINYGDTAYDFNVYTGPYSIKDENYSPDFVTKTANGDAYKWVTFSKPNWHAEPNQKVTIPYTIRVSESAASGGHYGVIFVETQPKVADTTGVVRKKRLAMKLLVNVNGLDQYEGKVESIDTPWYQSSPPISSKVRISNSGKTDFDASAQFIVSDIFGNIKYQTASENATILPGSTRAIDFAWDKASWLGIYKVSTESSLLDTTKKSETYVVVVPRWMPFLVVLMVFIGIAVRFSKKK